MVPVSIGSGKILLLDVQYPLYRPNRHLMYGGHTTRKHCQRSTPKKYQYEEDPESILADQEIRI